VLTGALALVALQVVVTSPETGRIADLFSVPAKAARALIDASVPAIPQLAAPAAAPTADTASLGTAPTPPARRPRTTPSTPATV
jgi:hypothetical protein